MLGSSSDSGGSALDSERGPAWYEIAFTPSSIDDMAGFGKRDQALIDEIEEQLSQSTGCGNSTEEAAAAEPRL